MSENKTKLETVIALLTEVAEKRGAYSTNHLTHAENVIENASERAKKKRNSLLVKLSKEMSEVGLEHYQVPGAWACAACLKTLVTIIRDKSQYRHGLTANEMRYFFPTVMHRTLATYGNRLRDLVKDGFAGRHDVHGERHFYPILLDEQGLIDHEKCRNCERVGVAEKQKP